MQNEFTIPFTPESTVFGRTTLYLGDCTEVLASLEPASIDAVVTDPPYGIRFMGKEWDGKDIEETMRRKTRKDTCRPDGCKRHDGAAFAAGTYDLSPSANQAFQAWTEQWAELCLRALKPGGYFLSFASPRTYHRMTSGIEDAGFEIRDQIMWLFGSGFPKSHNLEDEWDGWGTALKPAHEPIVVARKPLAGTVAENVKKHSTGAININACRVPTSDALQGSTVRNDIRGGSFATGHKPNPGDIPAYTQHDAGRWPANVIHDGSDEVRSAFPDAPGQQAAITGKEPTANGFSGSVKFGGNKNRVHFPSPRQEADKSAARFFYCAKASKRDRESGNTHPTVKPTDLMRYLCRLLTPPGGTVLDPFMGSGSTGKAAALEGFRFVGIEREPDYFAIACRRIAAATGEPVTMQEQPPVVKAEDSEPQLTLAI